MKIKTTAFALLVTATVHAQDAGGMALSKFKDENIIAFFVVIGILLLILGLLRPVQIYLDKKKVRDDRKKTLQASKQYNENWEKQRP